MILASLYMGISCSLGFMDTITSINSGFGSLMTGIGFPIGFGIMMMKGVELRGGFANGSKSPLNYYTGFAVSGYIIRFQIEVTRNSYSGCESDFAGQQMSGICRTPLTMM